MQMSNLKFLAMRNERSLEEHSKEIASLLRRVGSAEAEAERRGMREMEMRDWVEQEIRKIRSVHRCCCFCCCYCLCCHCFYLAISLMTVFQTYFQYGPRRRHQQTVGKGKRNTVVVAPIFDEGYCGKTRSRV